MLVTENVLTVVISVLASSGFSAAVMNIFKETITARAKAAIKDEYDQRLEVLKAQLASNNAIKLEQLRSNLQIAAAQSNVTFTHLQEKRAAAIEEVHDVLQNLWRRLNVYLGDNDREDWRPSAQIGEKVFESLEEFRTVCTQRKLFLPRETVGALQNAERGIRSFYERIRAAGIRPLDRQELGSLNQDVRGQFGQAIRALEERMRIALGDPPEQPAA